MSTISLSHLPHIRIHNANALSSPFTIGFPAMTAWLGFSHALQRKLNQHGYPTLKFWSTAVISHACDLQTYKGPGDFVQSIIGTANPLQKDGSRASFIEEARCHLDVSLLIEYENMEQGEQQPLNQQQLDKISQLLLTMKIAGGDILAFANPKIWAVNDDDDNDKEKRQLKSSLMPGYVLIERRELMKEAMEAGKDAIDALLDYLTVDHQCEKQQNGQIEWHSKRKTTGWIVPIATGFHGISSLAKALNQRDPNTPHRFAESIVTLGEFKMVHRLEQLADSLWYYATDAENNLYLCQQNKHNEFN
ncbi:type I-F CRISPR-associated protein Csy2 [Arsenophonus nasoniae]|uniref:CRISPR-associated protein Csy2 n=1 Tax=Arsenophonus nasoniae TaxID=638 RepID=A0A4P7KYI9_9GAMM|nr:type I-F CRISPR-associated protein Csy2 [Arsenophonus nasoniae]QBY45126.1 CRISPR-associated protein Csy2 [Arsenophonus nasoniae]WGM05330.1 type I-F CRISPR-associated protein Csy2 [Arsenophonus nasoniae]WGM10336.1 type I-F CRISPR-associated protein Csy2 [Arsenophonus nasoniae]WGM15051.1 type I-F CRISPR-associated protein Csy2 [Arsenophonus nasoniae]